jgi:nickel-dependent lactate racemase
MLYKILNENGKQKVWVPQYFWYGKEMLPLYFPGNWEIKICEMNGDSIRPLSSAEIKRVVDMPIGTDNIEALAKGKKEVAIVVDDITRPTEASLILPNVLESLNKAGINDESIRILISLGSHGAHTGEDFRKKLGDKIVERYAVYNHNCYENCIEVGKTRSGLNVKINEELMKCDLKIGIGAILPHLYTGYSGGGKLFLPGLAHIDTIDGFHSFMTPDKKGILDHDNPMICEIEDALSIIGVDFLINILVNTKGDIIGAFAGDPQEVYREGVREAEKVYKTRNYDDLDCVVSNAHLKVNEGDIALLAGINLLKDKGGTCILVMNSPSGQITHYLMRNFGKFIGGRQAVKRVRLSENINTIVYSQFMDRTTFDPYESQERIVWEKDWQRIINLTQDYHGKDNLKVGIIPDGTLQYF